MKRNALNDSDDDDSDDDDLYSSSSSDENEDDEKKTRTTSLKKKAFFGIANENLVCVGCREMNSPCFSQGLCLDPTVIELLDDGSNNNTKGGESLFLIEGQLVKSVGEEWKATSLVYSRTTTVKKTKEEEEFENPLKKRSKEEDDDDELLDGTRRLSGEQPPKTVESSTTDDTSATAAAGGGKTPHPLIALGLPADVEEAKAYLKRINAETIPHGNHRDFLYKNHLLHFYERRRQKDGGQEEEEDEEDGMCGSDCREQHGGSGKRFSNVEDHGRIEAVIRRQRKGHEQNLGGGDYVPLQRSSARANGKENESKEEEEREENQKDTVVDIRQIVEHERRGGNEVASQTRFKVEGICCPSEVPLIHNILDSMSGVRDVKVIVPTKMVLVEHAKSYAPVELLVDALNAAHLRASVADVDYYDQKNGGATSKFHAIMVNLPGPKILLACLFTVVSLLHFIKDDRGVFEHFKWVALGAIAVGLPEILLKSYGSLRMRVVDINTLMAIAIAGAVALQDFFEAAAVVSLFTLSEWLESRAMAKTSDAMSAVLALRVDEAELVNKDDQTTQKVAVESVNVDAIVRVRPGARVPLDGIVVDGSTAIDESALTGESKPVSKTVDSQVFGGTVNQKGSIDVRVTSVSVDSAYSRLIRLVEEAQSMRSSAERMIETFAKWYTPIVILAALLYGVIPVLISTDNAKESLYTACVLLVIACPCALVLSTPVVSVCGLTVCAKRGVVVKGSQFLERLGQLKTMYIDKTGTLTTGTFEMTEVKLATPPSEDASTPRPALGVGALLRWVCAVESKSSHPLAFAIQKNAGAAVRVAARQCVVTNYEQIDGVGVRAMVDNVLVELGNEKLAEKKLWTLSDLKLYEKAIRWETEIGATVVWVGINGKLGGILKAEDSLRPSAKDAIAKLQKSSIDVIILTGDNKGAAEMCAKNVGIDVHTNVFSSLTPNEKLNRITEEVQKQEKELVARKKTIFRTSGRGTIAMVGDGINDAPALSAADVGVAMGVAGTAAAMETAPVALLTNDLSRLADTIYIGRRCVLKIRQNIFFSVTTKLVVLGLTFAGLAGLWQAVVVDVGSALVVIFNGMSILREAEKDDARRNKISHEIGVKFAEEEKEKQKLLAERQQVHSHGHSQQVHSHVHSHAHDHSCCDYDKEEGRKNSPPFVLRGGSNSNNNTKSSA